MYKEPLHCHDYLKARAGMTSEISEQATNISENVTKNYLQSYYSSIFTCVSSREIILFVSFILTIIDRNCTTTKANSLNYFSFTGKLDHLFNFSLGL